MNAGAKEFGDILLSWRGGISPSLLKDSKTKDDLKTGRILLALSWLSVESKRGAPEEYVVRKNNDTDKKDTEEVIKAFREILTEHGIKDKEQEEWVEDCRASLTASIRDDAVWVNRSKAFKDQIKNYITSDSAEDIDQIVWDYLGRFIDKDSYLQIEADKKSNTQPVVHEKELV